MTHDWERTPVLARIDSVSWQTSVSNDKTDGTRLAVPRRRRGEKGDGDEVTVQFLPSRRRA